MKSFTHTSLLSLMLALTMGLGHSVSAQFFCANPDIPTLSLSQDTVCPGSPVTLTISGNLNDATEWIIYTNGCGSGQVDQTSGNSVILNPGGPTTYFVRGEGNCVIPGLCTDISVEWGDFEQPVINCGPTVTDSILTYGACSRYVTVSPPSVSDNCALASVYNDFNGGPDASGTYPMGTTMVTWYAEDQRGNSAQCIQFVTVEGKDLDCDGICDYSDSDVNVHMYRGSMALLTNSGLSPSAVVINHAGHLDFDRFDAFTLECWIRTEGGQSDAQIIGKFNADSLNPKGWRLRLNGAQPEFHMAAGAGDQMLSVPSGVVNIADSQWHHLAVSYDGSNSPAGFSFIIDGFAYAGTSGGLNSSLSASITNMDSVVIGAAYMGSTRKSGLRAYLDEIRVWNRVRSLSETRSELHLSLSGGCTANLVGYWKFNSVQGSVAKDESSFGMNASLVGYTFLEPSQAEVAHGISTTLNATLTGYTYTCPALHADHQLQLRFDGTAPGGEVVVTYLDTLPYGAYPAGFNHTLEPGHWVIDNYGPVQSGLNAAVIFKNTYYNGLNQDTSQYDLFKRGSRAYRTSDWVRTHTAADSLHYNMSYGAIEFRGLQSFSMLWHSSQYQPMPVTLSEFEVFPGREGAEISWRTASESGVDRFEVEQSTDGLQWRKVGRQAPLGTETMGHAYRMTDPEPEVGLNFYRLRTVDRDGSEAFSEVRTLNWGEEAGGSYTLYPNPAGEQVYLLPPEGREGALHLLLTDLQGRQLRSFEAAASAAEPIRLDLSGLSSGLYLLQIRDAGGLSHARIYKQ